jgi:GNAT superfamily N-acetyltransferase
MDTATLARREHENLLAMVGTTAALAPGALRSREGGVVISAIGLPVLLFNQLLIAGDDADPAAIERGVELLRERRAPFVVNLRDGTDDGWVPLVQRLGLVPVSDEPWMPGMALDPLPEPGSVPVPPGLEIRRATDGAGIRDHITGASAGFGMPPEWFDGIFDERLLLDPNVAVYAGYADGRPVTVGLGLRSGSTIGVYNIATIEPYRGRGHGAAMTARVIDDGASAGCELAVLQSSDMGFPIYEGMGFRTVVSYRGWVEPR